MRVLALAFLLSPASAAQELPADYKAATRTITYPELSAFLASVDGKGPVSVSVEGKSTQGRSLYLVHLGREAKPSWKVFIYAQQHGDEVSGKDALLYLIRDISKDPSLLPPGVDLWVMPQVNPDGAEAGTRRNAAGADLNRDHMILEQPETQALHRAFLRVRPHVALDCHEFSRDTEAALKRGLGVWPIITMDGMNNPLFDRSLVSIARRWVDDMSGVMAKAGKPFLRYWVGGEPPDDEQRASAPDIDTGLSSLGMYGGLSFIAEAANHRGTQETPLGERVDAYLTLFRRVIAGGARRSEDRGAIEDAKSRALPAFIPVNYLWVNPDAAVTEFPYVETATGKVVKVPTANLMTVMAVKKTVPTPLGYAVEPSAAAMFKALLERQAVPFEVLTATRSVKAETCTLLRVEKEFDDVYSRYDGRQIVARGEADPKDLPPGSLWVPLSGESAVRAALVLEPAMLYGLYQYPSYAALVGADKVLPVVRVVR